MNKLYTQYKFIAHVLLFFTLIVGGIIGIRQVVFKDGLLLFLLWNLFLAWIPLILSFMMYKRQDSRRPKKIWDHLIGLAWLLFFPNALYMITDVIHVQRLGLGIQSLSEKMSNTQWLNLLVLCGAILLGVLIGIFSLYIIHKQLDGYYGNIIGWAFSTFIIAISSYGIYLGRMPEFRSNSWDVLWPPNLVNKLLPAIKLSFSMDMVGFVVIMAVFLLSVYVIVYHLLENRKHV